MPRHLTRDTRTSLARALGHARRLTRRYVSGEHLMTMLVCAVSAVHPGPGRPARAVLHSCGATMEDVAEEIARRAGPGAVLFGGLDRDALAAVGIDLDVVRARIESSFGPEALTQAVHREPRPPGLKGGPSTLVLLQRAHPDIFEDALRAVISKAKERKS
jgi:Clp amino terminal domain, pathogenicity island component